MMRKAPKLESRRFNDFKAELLQRAKVWLPDWSLGEAGPDFGAAVLEVAARFNSEVSERIDRAGDKMARGFLDWLGIGAAAARPARLPVSFKLSDTATSPELAKSPVRLQTEALNASVTFETETDLQVVPGEVGQLVAVDPTQDAYFLPPPGLTSLKPVEGLPEQWKVKSFASANANQVQLEPALGLTPPLTLSIGLAEYEVINADGGIVTLKPTLESGVAQGDTVKKVNAFTPFGAQCRNVQEHALYLGHKELLKIETAARIKVSGVADLRAEVWQYWGKAGDEGEAGWHNLDVETDLPSGGENAVVLKKGPGAIEPLKLPSGQECNFIRAFRPSFHNESPDSAMLTTDRIGLSINPSDSKPDCDSINANSAASAEAFTNSSPIALANPFYPFGKEPKQFDSFYVSSKEAFSKKDNTAVLCFNMAAFAFNHLAYVQGETFGLQFLAAVAKDGSLYLLQTYDGSDLVVPQGSGLRPPMSALVAPSVSEQKIPLDFNPPFKTPLWYENETSSNATIGAAVTAKNAVWIWNNSLADWHRSGWENYGKVDRSSKPINGLLRYDGTFKGLIALKDGKLYVVDSSDRDRIWQRISLQDDNGDDLGKALSRISAVSPSGAKQAFVSSVNGLVAVDVDGTVYGVDLSLDGGDPKGICNELLQDADPMVTPSGVRAGNRLVVVTFDALAAGKRKILSFISSNAASSESISYRGLALPDFELEGDISGNELESYVTPGGAALGVAFAFVFKSKSGQPEICTWQPDMNSANSIFLNTMIPDQGVEPGGAPTITPDKMLIPSEQGGLITAKFDRSRLVGGRAKLETALLIPKSSDPLRVGVKLAIPEFDMAAPNGRKYSLKIAANPETNSSQNLYKFDVLPFKAQAYAYLKPAKEGNIVSVSGPNEDKLELLVADPEIKPGTQLYLETDVSGSPGKFYTVVSVNPANDLIELDAKVEVNDASDTKYMVPTRLGETLPLLELSAPDNVWDAKAVETAPLLFPGADPDKIKAKVFKKNASTGYPELVVLDEFWSRRPTIIGADQINFIANATLDSWRLQLKDTSSNPDLVWEYWDGKSWNRLPLKTDTTSNLRYSGDISFVVPKDMQESDWSGKTGLWIRSRLVGGDYGKERVTVVTKTDTATGGTLQTVNRSTEDIRAPQAISLKIFHYSDSKKDALPELVIAQDCGSVRDLTDANQTQGARVEAFIPLSVMLNDLDLQTSKAEGKTLDDCCCGCEGDTEPGAAKADQISNAAKISGRAIFVGFTAAPQGEPVNLLMSVDREGEFDALAPLAVSALGNTGFSTAAAKDETRAVSETGLLKLSITNAPTVRELFGQNLHWLRLAPAPGTDAWEPSIRGFYMNTVWARSAESMTRELLGSSDGAPKKTMKVTRPPLLKGSLELRVKEWLGEEERTALLEKDSDLVRSNVTDLPGDWVLWKQVADPADCDAKERVYALDETTGEIRFGDGLNGRIPPIGTDSIVAFKYERTEPATADGLPSNSVKQHMSLSLISPVANVESVTAADASAGGQAPQSVDQVLSFAAKNLRHRGRAVTARDFEDLVLSNFAETAQAKCIVRNGRIHLVVVMRGKNVGPSRAQKRAIKKLLTEAASPEFSRPGTLTIEGPALRLVHIRLRLAVQNLDLAGEVSQRAKRALASLFETNGGGDGWPLGQVPQRDDIAAALSSVSGIDSITNIEILEIDLEGQEKPWGVPMKPNQLVLLAAQGVAVAFVVEDLAA